MTQILAQLSVRRGPEALEFYAAAFGAVVDYQVGDESIVAQLSIGDASFWVADESPEHGNFSPETVGGCTTRMLLIDDDPDAAVSRAVEAGASLVHPCAGRARLAARAGARSVRPPLGDRQAARPVAAGAWLTS